MSRLAASFVLGYHGCDAEIARKLVNREDEIRPSGKRYDWLGPGSYFWEADCQRAFEWAEDAVKRGRIDAPAVVGAVIDLGNCLDLLNRENIELVREAHRLFLEEQQRSQLPVPENRSLDGEPERILRYLDRAVIEFLHGIFDEGDAAPFETVRGLFPEGEELFPGAGIRDRNHIQIAVRTPASILGLFYPPQYPPKS